MNRKYIVSIGVVVSMMSSIASAGYMYDNLDNSLGDTLTNRGNWRATSTNVVIAAPAVPNDGNAAKIPILQTLSNLVNLAATETNVWTDFWTIPRPFVSAVDAAPAVDPNTSAMFFVSNSSWAVVYGEGGAFTNVRSQDIWGTNHTVLNDGSSWQHVSVLHNYNSKKWSLFVDGRPLMTNMVFINTGLSKYDWFSVQNGGGNVSNVTWIDDVLITNRVPESLTYDHHNDGVRDAWELMYYGTIGVVSPTNDADGDGFNNSQESILGGNPAVQSPGEPGGSNMLEYVFNTPAPDLVSMDITNEASKAMRLVFNVGQNWTYQVVRSSSENGTYQYIGEFNSGTGPVRNWFIDPNALDSQKYYYRLVSTNGGISATNTERAVFYKQPRTQSSVYYWVGVPVDYPSGQNKLEGMLGTQLARGLHPNADNTIADEINVYNGATTKTFWLGPGPTWMDGVAPAVYTIEPGQGILVTRRAGGVTMTNAVFAGSARTSGSFEVSLAKDWNLVNWAFDTPTNSTGWGLGDVACEEGDEITINNQNRQQTGRTQNFIYLRYYGGGVWKDLNNYSADISNIKFFPGDAVFIRKRGAQSTTWTQTM
jgi:hypothetical protein